MFQYKNSIDDLHVKDKHSLTELQNIRLLNFICKVILYFIHLWPIKKKLNKLRFFIAIDTSSGYKLYLLKQMNKSILIL